MSALSKSVLFLLPFGKQMGVGHLVRQAVLAKAFRQKGYKTILWSSGKFDEIPSVFEQEAREAFDEILEPLAVIGQQSRFPAAKAVSDLYGLENLSGIVIDDYRAVGQPKRRATLAALAELAQLKSIKIAMVDGVAGLELDYADVIINLELSVDPEDYSAENFPKIIHGLDIALLREAFCSPESLPVELPNSPFMVMVGGTDPQLCSLALLRGMLDTGYNPVLVANKKGKSDEQIAELEHALGAYEQSAWLEGFTAGQMRTLLDNCHFSLTACATSPIWEHFMAGCPMIGVVSNPTLLANAKTFEKMQMPVVRATNHDELMASWGNSTLTQGQFDQNELKGALARLKELGYLQDRLPDIPPFSEVSPEGGYNLVARLDF